MYGNPLVLCWRWLLIWLGMFPLAIFLSLLDSILAARCPSLSLCLLISVLFSLLFSNLLTVIISIMVGYFQSSPSILEPLSQNVDFSACSAVVHTIVLPFPRLHSPLSHYLTLISLLHNFRNQIDGTSWHARVIGCWARLHGSLLGCGIGLLWWVFFLTLTLMFAGSLWGVFRLCCRWATVLWLLGEVFWMKLILS